MQENVITLEYLEAQKPPQPSNTLEHDDWVSAISARMAGCVSIARMLHHRCAHRFLTFHRWILTGCYDNKVRLWKADGSNTKIVCEIDSAQQVIAHSLAHFLLKVIEGHEAPITHVAFVSKEADNDGSFIVASTSKDETTKLWRVR